MFGPLIGRRSSNGPDIFCALFWNVTILVALDYCYRLVLPMLPAMWPLAVQPMLNSDAVFASTYLHVCVCVCGCAIEWITTGEHCGKIERNVWINYCSFWWQSESGPLTNVVVALNAQKCAETNHAFYLHAMQMWQTVSLLIFPVGILCDQHVNELSA